MRLAGKQGSVKRILAAARRARRRCFLLEYDESCCLPLFSAVFPLNPGLPPHARWDTRKKTGLEEREHSP